METSYKAAPLPPTSPNDRAVAIQGRDCKYLIVYCHQCKERHTIPVRTAGETLKVAMTYWVWDGNLTNPTVGYGDACIFVHRTEVPRTTEQDYQNFRASLIRQGLREDNISNYTREWFHTHYSNGAHHMSLTGGCIDGEPILPVRSWPPLKPPEKKDDSTTSQARS